MISPSKLGGAERRYFRLFNILKKVQKNEANFKYNFYFITTKATLNNLEKTIIEKYYRRSDIIFIPRWLENISYKEKKSINFLKKLLRIVELFALIPYLTLRAKKKNIQLIHFCVEPSIYSAILSLILPLFRIRYSFSVVNSILEIDIKRKIVKLSYYFTLRNNYLFVECLSESIKNKLIENFKISNHGRIYVAPCSFTDTELFKNSAIAHSFNKDIDFVMLSRFIPEKGFDFLFDALDLLVNEKELLPRFTIRLYGYGPYEDVIKKRINYYREKGIDISCNYTDNPFAILMRSRFLLSLQKNENYPSQSILEAYMCRVPVICTDVGETRKFVNENTGFLVNTPRELALLILKLSYEKNSLLLDKFANGFQFMLRKHNIENYIGFFLEIIKKQFKISF